MELHVFAVFLEAWQGMRGSFARREIHRQVASCVGRLSLRNILLFISRVLAFICPNYALEDHH